MNKKPMSLVILSLLLSLNGYTQQLTKNEQNSSRYRHEPLSQQLFQFGHADAFVSGLYKGIFPVYELKKYGNFGLGAPDLVDGELTIVNEKVYQSTADGKTFLAPDSLKVPFAMVTYFKTDISVTITRLSSLNDLYAKLSQYLNNKNAMYAIKLTGSFDRIKTRAFPKVKEMNFIPLSQMLDRQKFFEQEKINGTLVGFWIPPYLASINITGFHFHFLSDDAVQGGHVLEITSSKKIKVEISKLEDFLLRVPDDTTYLRYPFAGENNKDLRKVEKGGD